MNTLEVLTKARATISRPENWTKFIRRQPNKSGGYAYCALGAIDHALRVCCDQGCKIHPAVQVLALTLKPRRPHDADQHGAATCVYTANLVAQFNNSHSHTEVLAVFDRAIQRQREIEAMAHAPVQVEPEAVPA